MFAGPSHSVDTIIIIHKIIEKFTIISFQKKKKKFTIILSIINPSLFILLKFSYILMNYLTPNFKSQKK